LAGWHPANGAHVSDPPRNGYEASLAAGTVLFNPELYFLNELPAEMDAGETFSVIAMALVLSFLATVFPARRAARLDPVEALRYD